MSKVNVVYWSQSGNTQAMAEAVGKGAADAGAEVSVVYVGDASVNDLKDCKAFALGCPAMGAEVLEESEMDPFVADVESICGGKTIGLFGSYGWGDGQWMRDCINKVCVIVLLFTPLYNIGYQYNDAYNDRTD